MNSEPYYDELDELRKRLQLSEQAYIASESIRTSLQLQLEAITRTAERVTTRCSHGDNQEAFGELTALLHKQKKSN